MIDDVLVVIPTNQKVSVSGQKGNGKPSLLQLLGKEWHIDGGEIDFPAEFCFGGVNQEASVSYISLLDTALAAEQGRGQLVAKADTVTDVASLDQIHARLVDLDAFSGEAKAAGILSSLGFDQAAKARTCD